MVLFDSVWLNYDNQNYVKTIALAEEGRRKSDSLRYYSYFTSISSPLGNALIQTGDTLQAIKVFKESQDKARAYQNTDATEDEKLLPLITASIDLANVQLLSGDYNVAIENYKEALQLTREDDIEGLLIINSNLALAYLELNQPSLAYPFINKSEELVNELDIDSYRTSSLLLKGKYFYKIRFYQQAVENLNKSLSKAQELSYQEVVFESMELLIKSHQKSGNYKKAFELLQELDGLKENLYDGQRERAIQNATAQFKVNELEREMEREIEAEQVQAKQELQEATIKWSLIALTILLALSVLLVFTLRNRVQMNKQLKEKNQVYLIEKKRSENLLKARNALFSRISHELRTPMYGIVGISNMLIDDPDAEGSKKENIQSLKFSADYLMSLINNILEMNKLNSTSHVKASNEVVNLNKLCHQAVEASKYLAQNQTNTFDIQIDPHINRYYLTDPVLLMQVLINLLGNSNKFTEGGNIELSLTCLKSSDRNDVLRFKVTDDGRGISADKLKTIFKGISYDEQEDQYEGTGIGLLVTKRILKKLDSSLHIESTENVGTSTSFDIAMEKGMDDGSAPVMSIVPQEKIRENLSGLSILVVEDNKINQLVTRKSIERLQGVCTVVSSGEEAITAVQENKYDLVLMDINMPPGMDGFEATSHIRSFNDSIPIIALTAVEQLEIEQRMNNHAMNDFIIKPFKNEELLLKVSNALA